MKYLATKLLVASTAVLVAISALDANAAAIPGDLNADWRVDAADYIYARKNSLNLASVRTNYGKNAANVGVVIPAGSNIQSYVSANPTNTIFYLAPGTTRLSSETAPKDGDAFVSDSGSIL